ncbi:MAG: tetratricopeptide repeat protein, partial [Planctomycetes bacterium]|nr:tetratricopeptide repeat protein [Planctomycetota bacterium]
MRTETVRPNPWIVAPIADSTLFIATPLLILPAVMLASSAFPATSIHKWVMALGAMGHHLPGMMRAYGDRALFERFRLRFIAAPVVIGTLCFGAAALGSYAMLIVAFAWGIWHGFMQTHGLARIYDARVGRVSRAGAWSDWSLGLVWFFGAVLFSDLRMAWLFERMALANLAFPGAGTLAALRWFAATIVVAVTAAYLVAEYRRSRRLGPSPVKWTFLVASLSFWCVCNLAVSDLLLGLVLFEVFHDVQYLTIVWIFNRRRAESDESVGSFTRFLFRRSKALVALYLALIFAYGLIGPLGEAAHSGPVRTFVLGLVTFSTLLHFYYDGFIWKIRDRDTRQGLGVAAGDGRSLQVDRTRHALKFAPLILVSVLLYLGERGRATGFDLPLAERLAATTPGSADVWFRLGSERLRADDASGAAAAFERGLAHDAQRPHARANLGAALLQAGRDLEAETVLRAAWQEDETDERTRSNLALLSLRRGLAAAEAGQREDAAHHLGMVGRFHPERARAAAAESVQIGFQSWRNGAPDEAVRRYEVALWLRPGHVDALLHLAMTRLEQDRLAEALSAAESAAAGHPEHGVAQSLRDGLRALQSARDLADQGDLN